MELIPITVLTGFLGAGKTTLINRIIKQKDTDENIVIIINEFGEVSVDSDLVMNTEEDIYEMNNGCMCCVVRQDIVDMLQNIKSINDKKNLDINHVIIETSGLADPAPIVQVILQSPELQENFVIDSVVTLVDASNALYQLSHYKEAVDQIAFTDTIMITKKEKVEIDTYNAVIREIREINPYVQITDLDIETVNMTDVIGQDLFDRALSSKEKLLEDLENMNENLEHTHHHDHDHHEHDEHCHHDHEHGEDCDCGHHHDHDHDHHDHDHMHHHHHSSGIDSFSIRTTKPLNLDKLNQWTSRLIFTYGQDLMRYKGILYIEGVDRQVVFQGVNQSFMTEYGNEWKPGEERTMLVIIGKDLPKDKILDSFERDVVTK